MKEIYCGTEDFVRFFEDLITILDLDLEYDVIITDGEYEILIEED